MLKNGGQGRNRTADASLFRAALYRLSYLANSVGFIRTASVGQLKTLFVRNVFDYNNVAAFPQTAGVAVTRILRAAANSSVDFQYTARFCVVCFAASEKRGSAGAS